MDVAIADPEIEPQRKTQVLRLIVKETGPRMQKQHRSRKSMRRKEQVCPSKKYSVFADGVKISC